MTRYIFSWKEFDTMKRHILYQPILINTKLVEGLYAGCRDFDLRLSIAHPGMTNRPDLHSFDGLLSTKLNYVDEIRAHGGKAVCYSMQASDMTRAQFDATVACDEFAICRIGATHFLQKGYENFACSLDTIRKQAFIETLHRAGRDRIHAFPLSAQHPGTLEMRVEFLRSLPAHALTISSPFRNAAH